MIAIECGEFEWIVLMIAGRTHGQNTDKLRKRVWTSSELSQTVGALIGPRAEVDAGRREGTR